MPVIQGPLPPWINIRIYSEKRMNIQLIVTTISDALIFYDRSAKLMTLEKFVIHGKIFAGEVQFGVSFGSFGITADFIACNRITVKFHGSSLLFHS